MGWQDRDYARASPGPTWSLRPGSRLIGGSVVTTLITVNVAVFALEALFPPVRQFLSGSQRLTPAGVEIVPGWGELIADRVLHGEVWRLFTAQYLHAGVWHLFFNMLVLHFMGRPIERMWPPKRFFAVYTLCGLSGNVFFTLLAWGDVIPGWMPAVGASGCIYGLIGIVAVLFPHATVLVWFVLPINIRTLAIVLGAIAFMTVLQRGANFGGEACHLAGLVFGVWWAKKGDAWWSRRQMTARYGGRQSSRGGWFGRANRGGSTFSDKISQRRADEEEIDRILRKVYDNGIMSLSEAERRALREATDRQRQREAEAGRIDRL